MDIPTQVVIHQGITGTFLQHNKFFKSAGKESKLLSVDGIKFVVEYKKAAFYAHQHFAKKLCDEHGQFLQEPIGVAGWLYPGAVVRHAAFNKQTKFEEKPEHALALLFAPVACQYFIMRSPLGRSASLSHTQPQQTQYALVIPKVTDLEIYAQRCQVLGNLGYKNYHVSSLGDAGLRFLTYETTIELARHNQVKRCQVILFGTVAWSEQQKTRTEIAIVEATEEVDFHYKLSCSCFHKFQVVSYKNENFVIPSLAQGIIADNLAMGLSWWANFYTKVKNNNLFKQIAYESQGIYNMIQNTEWNIEAQKLFIKACHEALKKIYAKIYGRTNEGEYAQIERENTRILSQLGRCTNAENFRKFIAEFWGRSGQISILEEYWEELLPLTTGTMDWKVARDLTFIALASYPKSKTAEARLSEKGEINSE